MSFFAFGVNHKECPLAIREKLHLPAAVLEEALRAIRQCPEVEEVVILSTCNRVEIYGYAEKVETAKSKIFDILERLCQVPHAAFATYLYHYEGKQVIHHLFRVAAGLDSLVVGENEILGQVRQAFRTANQNRSVHAFLYRLMEKALKIGKDVRTTTKINEGAVSIPSVAVELAQKIFGRLAGQRVMLLGTGDMSALALENLRNAGAEVVYVVSRSQERGERLAVECGAQWRHLDQWEKHAHEVDILIAATSAPHFLVRYEQIQAVLTRRHHKPLFLIDIAVPRNIEPRINTIDDVFLYNIDDLKGVSASNLRLRYREIEAAERMIEEAMLAFQSWLEQLVARPTLERYEMFLDDILNRELTRFVAETGVSEEVKNRFKERLRAQLLHPPLEKIKEASLNGGVSRYIEALHALFDLDSKP